MNFLCMITPVWMVAPSSTRLSAISLAISWISGVKEVGGISFRASSPSTSTSMWELWTNPSPKVRGICLFTKPTRLVRIYVLNIQLKCISMNIFLYTSISGLFKVPVNTTRFIYKFSTYWSVFKLYWFDLSNHVLIKIVARNTEVHVW